MDKIHSFGLADKHYTNLSSYCLADSIRFILFLKSNIYCFYFIRLNKIKFNLIKNSIFKEIVSYMIENVLAAPRVNINVLPRAGSKPARSRSSIDRKMTRAKVALDGQEYDERAPREGSGKNSTLRLTLGLKLNPEKPKKTLDAFRKCFDKWTARLDSLENVTPGKLGELKQDFLQVQQFIGKLGLHESQKSGVVKRLSRFERSRARLNLLLFERVQSALTQGSAVSNLHNVEEDILWLMDQHPTQSDVYASLFIRYCIANNLLREAAPVFEKVVVNLPAEAVYESRALFYKLVDCSLGGKEKILKLLEAKLQQTVGEAFILTHEGEKAFESEVLHLLSLIEKKKTVALSDEQQIRIEKFMLYASGNADLGKRLKEGKHDAGSAFIRTYSLFTAQYDLHATVKKIKRAFSRSGVQYISSALPALNKKIRLLQEALASSDTKSAGRMGRKLQSFVKTFISLQNEFDHDLAKFEALQLRFQKILNKYGTESIFLLEHEGETVKKIADSIADRLGDLVEGVTKFGKKKAAQESGRRLLGVQDLLNLIQLRKISGLLEKVIHNCPSSHLVFDSLWTDVRALRRMCSAIGRTNSEVSGYRCGDVLLTSEKAKKSFQKRTDIFANMTLLNPNHCVQIVKTLVERGVFAVQPWATGDKQHASIVVDYENNPVAIRKVLAEVAREFVSSSLDLAEAPSFVGYRPNFLRLCTKQGFSALRKHLKRQKIISADTTLEEAQQAVVEFIQSKYQAALSKLLETQKSALANIENDPKKATLSMIKAHLLQFPGGALGRAVCQFLDWIFGIPHYVDFSEIVLQRDQSQPVDKKKLFCSEFVAMLIRHTTNIVNEELTTLTGVQTLVDVIPKDLPVDAIHPNYLEQLLLQDGIYEKINPSSPVLQLLFGVDL